MEYILLLFLLYIIFLINYNFSKKENIMTKNLTENLTNTTKNYSKKSKYNLTFYYILNIINTLVDSYNINIVYDQPLKNLKKNNINLLISYDELSKISDNLEIRNKNINDLFIKSGFICLENKTPYTKDEIPLYFKYKHKDTKIIINLLIVQTTNNKRYFSYEKSKKIIKKFISFDIDNLPLLNINHENQKFIIKTSNLKLDFN